MTGPEQLVEASGGERGSETPLLNRGFVLLSLAFFLVFCNIAVFFEFYDYLKRLGIPANSRGLIIGIFSLTALVIRPFISAVLNPLNAKRWFIVGVLGALVALLLYGPATSVSGLLLVRILHGGFYVLMASASVAALVGFIDQKHSGQAFGILAVITIVPYAVVPPLAEVFARKLFSFPALLAITGFMTLLVIPMIACLPSPKVAQERHYAKISWRQAKNNLKDRRLIVLLCSSLLMYVPFSTVFYFINSFGKSMGITDAGWFFTVATGTEIGIRVLFGKFFDRLPKRWLLVGALMILAAAFSLLTLVSGLTGLLALAFAFGVGWGLAMPMVNAILFDISRPEMRAFNTNLGYEVFQGGFFLGPFLGAWLQQVAGYGGLFWGCTGACLLGAALMSLLPQHGPAEQGDTTQ